jgi:hypothetical protein
MRGHALFEWELTPDRLLVWALRSTLVGRCGCVGLHAALQDQLGAHAGTAFCAIQQLAFAIQAGEGRLHGLAPPYAAHLAAGEALIVSAAATAQGGNGTALAAAAREIAGAGAPLAAHALSAIAAAFTAAGLTFEAAPAYDCGRTRNTRPSGASVSR